MTVDSVGGFSPEPTGDEPIGGRAWPARAPHRGSREDPSGWRSLGWPLLIAGAGLGAAAVVHFHDPHAQGSYGICPFYALTGWWCPGCGGLRGMHDLTEGRILDAAHSNIFLLPLLLGFAVWWVDWGVRRWRGLPTRPFVMSRTTLCIVLTLLTIFTVLRNTPWGTWLAPV